MAKQQPTKTPASADVHLLGPEALKGATPIHLVGKVAWAELAKRLEPPARGYAEAIGFDAAPGKLALLPKTGGGIAAVVYGVAQGDAGDGPLAAGMLPGQLPAGDYRLEGETGPVELAALAWVLGSYGFDRYRSKRTEKPRRLAVGPDVDRARVVSVANAVYLGRDLINTPANDLGPEELEQAARMLAKSCKADVSSIVGDKLVAENFPMLHAVGRASPRSPRLVDIRWGKAGHRTVTLVGKGICFDTGGLNIKTGDFMTS